MRNAQRTPAVELRSSVKVRVEHVMLEPSQPVTISLGRLFPVTPSEEEADSLVVLVPVVTQEPLSRELMQAAIEA